MRKIIAIFALVLTTWVSASAQKSEFYITYAAPSLNSTWNEGDDGWPDTYHEDFYTFGAGYNYIKPLSSKVPLNLVFGGSFNIGKRCNSNDSDKTLTNIQVPVSIMYAFKPAKIMTIEPNAGITFTYYTSGSDNFNIYVYNEDKVFGQIHRFQTAGHLGCDVCFLDKFVVGLKAHVDVTKFVSDKGKQTSLEEYWTVATLKLGYRF